MRQGAHIIGGAVVVAIAFAWAVLLAGQPPATNRNTAPTSRAAHSEKWTMPRTPWGHPDLQGLWNNSTPTPLERPADVANREFLSDEEWAARAKEAATRADERPDDPDADLTLAYNTVWWDRGAPLRRTSLIIDPANGRLPPLTPEGQKRLAERAAAAHDRGPADSWEDRPLPERCLVYHAVPPLPTGYNNNYLIAQTRDSIAIRYEMLAQTRIIPLDGIPHLGPEIPQWLGNSRGRWEGDTLVVDTTNYNSKTHLRFFPVAHETLRVIERFTRTAADTIDYRFTVDNPTMYTRPWTAVVPLTKAPGPIYEYACHEANYSLANVLRGYRHGEAAAGEQRPNTRPK
jgi:hypothetical protein